MLPLVCALAIGLSLAVSSPASAETKPDKKTAEDTKPVKKAAKKDGAGPAGATLVASFGDWGAYTANTGKSKICYALSEPKTRSPATLKDKKAYLFVSFRPAEKVRNEVAAVLNFTTKDGGPASLAIGSTNFDLVTKGENAWVKNASDEASAIDTMAKGGSMTLTATSARGSKTTDKYSLAGFPQALDQAKRDCP